ncbi:MAG TPA: ADP-ribosyltransferase [Methanoregulaceae archaeon]|nr:ADP-ribosyltransferase [Methanoregulaceae archaeon]
METLSEEDIPWELREDLSDNEKRAIKDYLEEGIDINRCLRNPYGIQDPASFCSFLFQLDKAITNSHLKNNYRVFRGVGGDYGSTIKANLTSGETVLNPEGYTSFSFDKIIALEYATQAGDDKILFIANCKEGENALFIGGDESEIIFPRGTRWMVTRMGVSRDSPEVTFIYLERIIDNKNCNDV